MLPPIHQGLQISNKILVFSTEFIILMWGLKGGGGKGKPENAVIWLDVAAALLALKCSLSHLHPLSVNEK